MRVQICSRFCQPLNGTHFTEGVVVISSYFARRSPVRHLERVDGINAAAPDNGSVVVEAGLQEVRLKALFVCFHLQFNAGHVGSAKNRHDVRTVVGSRRQL